MKITIALFSILVLVGCKVQQSNQTLTFADNPVVAHRGAWKTQNHPENSIAALREAINLKCTGSEFDVWMTADDSLVVNHDHDFQGMEVEKSTYQELLSKKLANGEKLPTAREYLIAGMQNNNATRLVFEIKPSQISKERGRILAEKAFKLVQELNAEKYVVYISFDIGIMERLLELNPKANCQYLKGELSPAQLKSKGIQGLDYYFKTIQNKPDWVTEAKNEGIALNAWTVNEESDIEWFLDRKFEFITTNEPELVLELFSKAK
ncbi:glycerophosphoryl diester phosphodiesterase [Spirosomataceae bacterium TFI 002]|nr:glycerophosphoryl diester phosphodiesterase [Spirosomataceae bacterium TFI 002]